MSRSRSRNRNPNAAQQYQNAKVATAQTSAFHFTHKGKVFELPPIKDGILGVDAGSVIDAVMNQHDQMADVRLGLATLLKSGVDAGAMAALREKPFGEFSKLLQRWMTSHGADLGKSES
jgi:hypothetical protein